LSDFDPTYLVTLDEIYHSHWAARKKRRIGFLREAVDHFWPRGHPTRLIHITGTNGKGSVAHYLEQGLSLFGKTGSWTGPHVFDYAERFHVDGRIVDHNQIVSIYREILEPYQQRFVATHGGASLSFAEIGILLALHLFDRNSVVRAVTEVGAGGRYTPLMALDMEACVLTNIGSDHPKTLGSAVWQRALEKAGIARPGVPFFTSAEGRALDYVVACARAEGAPVHVVDQADLAAVTAVTGPDLPSFQIRNLALATKLIRALFPSAATAELLARMRQRLPGRFWAVTGDIIADVAHNNDKMTRLAEELTGAFPGRRFHFLLGLSRSRDARETFTPILPLAERVVVTSAGYAGRDPESVADELRGEVPDVTAIADPEAAYRHMTAERPTGAILVLTGSAYMIDQALNPNRYIAETNASYGRRANDEL